MIKKIVSLYKEVSTELPEDVVKGLKQGLEKEKSSLGKNVIKSVLENVALAQKNSVPICQDTGIPVFYVSYHEGSQKEFTKAIIKATEIATSEGYLRPNAVDPITGENVGGVGEDFPRIYFHHWDKEHLEITLMLKGGGSENVGKIYSLPNSSLNAGRDISGIKKCVIDAMFKAQGNGCSPNIIGVGVGGSKISSMSLAKKQLLRKLDDVNDDKVLSKLEGELYLELNKLGIGPMGLGGDVTVLGVKIGKQHRHPASFFVAVAFMCWACRRGKLVIKD